MWILQYYFDIWNHLQGENVSSLYDPLVKLSDSEKTKVIQLFENTIDQVSFNTADYNRIKNLLIDWYSSFRTIATFQSQISDPFIIPDSDLDELFRSFGYPYSNQLSLLNNKVNNNKVNFFLDLVNLYKIKGTPESILKAFTYYGIGKSEIYEYSIKRKPDDPTNHLIFEGTKIAYTGYQIPLPTPIKNYELVTYDDPHWMYTEPELLQAINNSVINLPSKSPYFSLRIYYDLVGITATMATINKIISDQYDLWLSVNIHPEKNAFITSTGSYTSILELYLSMIYIYNTRNSRSEVIPEKYDHYYEDPTGEYDQIMTDYYQIHGDGYYEEFNPITGESELRQLDRDHRELELNKWYNHFSEPFSLSFIKTKDDVESILESLNPELKNKIDHLMDIVPLVDLLGPFLYDFQIWVTSYLGTTASNLAFLVLGEEEIVRELSPIIDFFKPYHARLIALDMAFTIQDRLNDSILLSDPSVEKIVETTWDYSSCDGEPCCPEGDAACESCDDCGDYDDRTYVDAELRGKRHYSRGRYDCGSCYDIGAACDCKKEAIEIEINDVIRTKFTCRNTLFTDEPYTDISFIEIGGVWQTIRTLVESTERLLDNEFVETVDYSANSYIINSGGFTQFDCGGCFDKSYGNDLCQISIIDH